MVTDQSTNRVIGYYAIAMESIPRSSVIGLLRRNRPDLISIVIIARLALEANFHGSDIGAGLLKDCVILGMFSAS